MNRSQMYESSPGSLPYSLSPKPQVHSISISCLSFQCSRLPPPRLPKPQKIPWSMDESCEVALYNMIAEDYWGFGTGHRKTQTMVWLHGMRKIIWPEWIRPSTNTYCLLYYNYPLSILSSFFAYIVYMFTTFSTFTTTNNNNDNNNTSVH